MIEDVEFARSFKQPGRGRMSTSCPRCGYGTVDGLCHGCDHQCPSGCGQPLDRDRMCPMCGRVSWKCPGDGCKSAIHKGEKA